MVEIDDMKKNCANTKQKSWKMVRRLMPKSLARLKSSTCTVDCTETLVDRPHDREIYCLTFSDYKRHNTVKYLVPIAPNGMISYISPVWGGKASDRKITLADGFLDNLRPGDLMLAGKIRIRHRCLWLS